MDESPPEISVVVPVRDEEDNIDTLLAEIAAALAGRSFEVVYVDDGSADGTPARLAAARARMPGLRVLRHRRSAGQSAALVTGIRAARGTWIATLDGDGQNDPADIGKLVAALADADVAYGVRARRRDSAARVMAGRLANAIRRAALGDDATDTGCTLKVIRREHVDLLVPFNGLHRYLPAFFARSGLRAVEIPVNHRPRRAGVSKYTLGGRAMRGIRDLVGVRWLLSRRIAWPPDQVP